MARLAFGDPEKRGAVPKLVDHDARRAEVVAAAWRTIQRHGLAGVTMRGIAAEAGSSTGLLNHYFADKNAVLQAALELTRKDWDDRLYKRAESEEPGLPALRAVLEESLPFGEEGRIHWILWMSFWEAGIIDKSVRTVQEEGHKLWRALLKQHIRVGITNGEFRHDIDVRHEVDRLVITFLGIGVQSTLLGVERPRSDVMRFLDDAIGVLRPAAP
jgi:AcrR family transcriptional regulator